MRPLSIAPCCPTLLVVFFSLFCCCCCCCCFFLVWSFAFGGGHVVMPACAGGKRNAAWQTKSQFIVQLSCASTARTRSHQAYYAHKTEHRGRGRTQQGLCCVVDPPGAEAEAETAFSASPRALSKEAAQAETENGGQPPLPGRGPPPVPSSSSSSLRLWAPGREPDRPAAVDALARARDARRPSARATAPATGICRARRALERSRARRVGRSACAAVAGYGAAGATQ